MKKLFLIPLLALAACTKDKTKSALDQLPPATQTGANTFGCLVNGVPVYTNVYKSTSSNGGSQFLDQTWNYKLLTLFAITKNNSRQDYTLTVNTSSDSIVNKHTEADLDCSLIVTENIGTAAKGAYNLRADTSSFITITKYTGNPQVGNVAGNILSGVFDLSFTNRQGNSVHLTNGRFDIKYR